MQMFVNVSAVYLHRAPVDFRKSINGLSVTVKRCVVCVLQQKARQAQVVILGQDRLCAVVQAT